MYKDTGIKVDKSFLIEERGLKYKRGKNQEFTIHVVPHRGTWIEVICILLMLYSMPGRSS